MKAVAAGMERHDMPSLATIFPSYSLLFPFQFLHLLLPRSEDGHPGKRVGRHGLTLLHWEEDGWIGRTTVAIAM